MINTVAICLEGCPILNIIPCNFKMRICTSCRKTKGKEIRKIARVLHFRWSQQIIIYLTRVIRYYFKQNERFKLKKYDPARTRTWNPLIRSQTPYPLRNAASWDPQEDSTSCYFSNQGSSRCSLLAMVLKRYWLRISVVNSTIRSSRISPPNGSLSTERLVQGIHSREWKSGECRENLQGTAHKKRRKTRKTHY